MSEKTNPSFAFIHILRVFAAFAVIVIHVSAIFQNNSEIDSFNWYGSIFYNSFSRWCVPVFVMLSGYLLTKEQEEPLKTFYSKRFSKLFLPVVVWCLLYSLWAIFYRQQSVGISIKNLFTGRVYYHLWYLYMLLGLYAFVPFFQILSLQLHKKAFLFFLFLLFGLLTMYHLADVFYFKSNGPFFTLFLLYIPYYFFGAYMRRYPLSLGGVGKPLFVFIISGVVNLLLFTYFSKNFNGQFASYFFSYLSLLVLVSSVAIFQVIYEKWSRVERVPKLMLALSECSLGIYILHPMLMDMMMLVFPRAYDGGSWLLIPLYVLLFFVLSFVVVFLLHSIKGVKRLI